jgi:hypothetical protein
MTASGRADDHGSFPATAATAPATAPRTTVAAVPSVEGGDDALPRDREAAARAPAFWRATLAFAGAAFERDVAAVGFRDVAAARRLPGLFTVVLFDPVCPRPGDVAPDRFVTDCFRDALRAMP